MTISQIFILSPRGDTIINKDYRGDALPNMHEMFFRKVKFWDRSDAPPVFQIEDVTYIYIKRNSLIIACTTRFNVSPSATIELLNRMAKVFKDYCGILTEESIRKNFILIYELLDEMLDFGYPQITSTEMLKSCVHNEAVLVKPTSTLAAASSMLSMSSNKTKASSAANIPITMMSAKGGNSKNEIYVDIVERLTVLFNASGFVVNSSIDGSILMKSFLSGNPELRLALNEDLVIGKGGAYGSVILDDCNFHECVHLDEFESSRTLHFLPPDGEFSVLNYRITADFRPPFKIYPTIEETGSYKLDAVIVIRADIPDGNYGSNVIIRMPVPRCTVSASAEFASEIPGCSAEYNASEKKVIWTIRKFVGGSEMTLRAKITMDQLVTASHKKEVGPVSMTFEIPMHNVSHLQVRYLRISETHKSYNPCRWVRYITQSSSYVCRM
mmetsp:Transcript_16203/g.23629  ORF Transcript_16203/g.23629 Transcript_16203/m.23629 type:complete len:441 (-) Transcript_16203:145-1467(-)